MEIPNLPSSQLDSFTVNDVDVLDDLDGPGSRAWYFYEEFTHEQAMTHLSRAVAKIWETGVRCSEMSLNFGGEVKEINRFYIYGSVSRVAAPPPMVWSPPSPHTSYILHTPL